MAHCKQALKRIRQSEKHRIARKSVRNEIKSLTKRLDESIAKKDEPQARALFVQVISKLDKAAKTHIYHRNAADRRKSKLARILNTLSAARPAADGAAPSQG